MTARVLQAAALLVTLLAPVTVAAQHVDALREGDRIRFRQLDWPAAPRLEGTVVARDPDSLRVALRPDGATATFAVRRMVDVEQSIAVDTRGASIRRWAFGGTLAGMATLVGGALAGDCLRPSSSTDPNCQPSARGVTGALAAGALLGGILGTIWGSVRRIDEWVPLAAARAVRVEVAPMHGGVGIRFALGR